MRFETVQTESGEYKVGYQVHEYQNQAVWAIYMHNSQDELVPVEISSWIDYEQTEEQAQELIESTIEGEGVGVDELSEAFNKEHPWFLKCSGCEGADAA